jgi:hypothetical protein|tara:strand:+ start:708 stop:953 length:246 start_codon:yes stop_codon:yes gene_type:complete
MIGKRKTSKYKSIIQATVQITVDHDTLFSEEELLDEFDAKVSEDFSGVMNSDSELLQPTSVTVVKEDIIKSNGIKQIAIRL